MEYYHSKYGSRRKRKRPRWMRFLLWFLFLIIIASLVAGYFLYQVIYSDNVWSPEGKAVSLYIPGDATFEEVKQSLYSKGVIENRSTFEWLAKRKKYPELIKPGHYLIKDGMSNDELINMLRLGKQTPVQVIFNNIRTKQQLAKNVGKQIEADSSALIKLMNDSVYQASLGLGTETALALFIPNTYEFYWNTSAEQFMDRMHREYRLFWDGSRDGKATALDMSRPEVVIMASIVEKETNKNDEKAKIAGVYLNRLERNWLLQA
ncbi:MAG: endolytic transglycosylase MltG, partial [Bacteroidales bacterium]|nr:endolytic transglycosylase MltG [Bacteroidales bacterium]